MKYQNEKPWQPKSKEDYFSFRKEKRDLIKFSKKIQKKGTIFIKWIFNNYLTDNQKEKLFHLYKNDISYYKIISKNVSSNKVLYSILSTKILSEIEFKSIKRKWIIKKLVE